MISLIKDYKGKKKKICQVYKCIKKYAIKIKKLKNLCFFKSYLLKMSTRLIQPISCYKKRRYEKSYENIQKLFVKISVFINVIT